MAQNEAKKDVKKVSRIKAEKKVWYKIIAPKVFGEKELGESYLTTPEAAVGRIVKINLRDLTGNMKDQNAYASFKIIGTQGTTLLTTALGYELTPSSVKRMVRKNADRIDDYYAFATKDGKKVVIKSLMITIHLTHRSLQAKLRKQLGESLAQEIRKVDFDTFLSNVVAYRVQAGIKKKLSKLYPLKELAIRILSLREHEQAPIMPEVEAAPAEISTQTSEESQETDQDVDQEQEMEEAAEAVAQ